MPTLPITSIYLLTTELLVQMYTVCTCAIFGNKATTKLQHVASQLLSVGGSWHHWGLPSCQIFTSGITFIIFFCCLDRFTFASCHVLLNQDIHFWAQEQHVASSTGQQLASLKNTTMPIIAMEKNFLFAIHCLHMSLSYHAVIRWQYCVWKVQLQWMTNAKYAETPIWGRLPCWVTHTCHFLPPAPCSLC